MTVVSVFLSFQIVNNLTPNLTLFNFLQLEIVTCMLSFESHELIHL